MSGVHPSAILDEEVLVGEGTRIWHWVHVCRGARIGRDCVLGQGVYIGPRVRVGDRVKIQNHVSVFEGVTLEDEVFCGPSAVFTNVLNPRSGVDRRSEFRETRVGKGASIGANATVVCGVNIGRYAMVGAGAVVTHDVADFEMVVGTPARRLGWISRAGHRLAFDDGLAVCPGSGERYRLVAGVAQPEQGS